MSVLDDALGEVLDGLDDVLNFGFFGLMTGHWDHPDDSQVHPPDTPVTPLDPAPKPPPDDLSGAAADAAKRVDAAQAKAATDIARADDQLSEAMLRAHSSSAAGTVKLQALQQSIIDQVNRVGSDLDTPAGQARMADFLQTKISDIQDVLASADLDSRSQAAVMDALTATYKAAHDGKDSKPGDAPAKPGDPPAAPSPTNPANPANPPAQPPDSPGGGGDPGVGGLDPSILGGIPAALGGLPGALGGIPASLGGMIPGLGGGGMGGGEPFGGGLGSLRDPDLVHEHHGDHQGDDKPDPLKDQADGDKDKGDKAAPVAKADQSGQTPAAAAPAAAAGPTPTKSTTVTLPDNQVRTAASPALAQAVRSVLAGDDVEAAFSHAGLSLPPIGAPVVAPVSPDRIELGTVGMYSDHEVVALSAHDVWVNGNVTPIDQLPTGPNFLGWTQATTAPAPAPAPSPAPSPPPPAT
jgi:hypothetical protein